VSKLWKKRLAGRSYRGEGAVAQKSLTGIQRDLARNYDEVRDRAEEAGFRVSRLSQDETNWWRGMCDIAKGFIRDEAGKGPPDA